MKNIYITIFVCALSLLSGSALSAQTLASSGTWKGTTLQSSEEVELTGNITLTGPIVIPDGVTLTITRSDVVESGIPITTASNFTVPDGQPNCMFEVRQGGTLNIIGTSQDGNKAIYLKGGTTSLPVFYSEKWKTKEEWQQELNTQLASGNHHDFKGGGAIWAVGNVNLTRSRIFNMYSTGDGAAIYRPANNKNNDYTYGRVTITDSRILQCVAQSGPAIYVASQRGQDYGEGNSSTSCEVIIQTNSLVCDNASRSTGVCGSIRADGGVVGKITITSSNIYRNYAYGRGAAINWNDGTTMLQHGTMLTLKTLSVKNNYSEGAGGAICCGTSLSMNAVSLENNLAGGVAGALFMTNSSNLTMINGCRVVDNTSSGNGGGINFNSTGLFLSEGSVISGNEVTDGAGGGVYIANNGGSLSMKGGEVSANSSSTFGAGIASNSPESNLSFEDIDIRNNIAKGSGGGLYATGANISMTKVKVRGNQSTESHGAGMYLINCNTTLKGSTISENITGTKNGYEEEEVVTTGFGGGVYIYQNEDGVSSFTMSENSEVSSNTAVSGGGIFLNGGDYNNNGCLIKYNTAVWRGGGVYVQSANSFNVTSGEISYNKVKEWHGGGIYFNAAGVTMIINGGSITNNEAENQGGGGIYVRAGSLNVSSGYISYNKSKVHGGGINFNSSEGSLTINGGNISENQAVGNGGGIYVADGNFTIENGLISKNVSDGEATSGGGIYFTPQSGGVMTMKGGSVTENTSTNLGGGIIVRKGKLDITAGEISGNVSSFGGGGIAYYVADNEILTIDGGRISRNTSGKYGGGIYLVSGRMSIKNGEVSLNEAIQDISYGGGVCMAENAGATEISGGQLFENTAYQGGGLFAGGGNLTLNDGRIYKNTARWQGGGLFLFTPGDVIIANGEISKNSAYSGAGVFIKGGMCDINGGKISDNSASQNGGGLYLSASKDKAQLAINNGTIEKNQAGNMGGGLVVDCENADATMSGGRINSNTAPLGGGIVVSRANCRLSVSGGQVYDNVARIGGGAYVSYNATLTFSDGIMCNNKAVIMNPNAKIATTGYAKTPSDAECQGFGGGVCVANATMIFDPQTSIGLYGNYADMLGDDVYARGDNTYVTLPNVNKMNLSGYQTITQDLQWMEDYMNGDTGYAKGTKVNTASGYVAKRYRQAVADKSDVQTVDVPDGGKQFTCYLALALGYEILNLTIERNGLMKGENAIYKISKWNETSKKWETYAQVLVSGPEEATTKELADQMVARKSVAVNSGKWRAEEIGWDWSYQGTSVIERELQTSTSVEDRNFVFTASKATEIPQSQYSESVVVNDFGSGEVVTK